MENTFKTSEDHISVEIIYLKPKPGKRSKSVLLQWHSLCVLPFDDSHEYIVMNKMLITPENGRFERAENLTLITQNYQ